MSRQCFGLRRVFLILILLVPFSYLFALQVVHACYTKVSPSVEVEKPELVVWSESVAELLELDPKE